MSSRRSRPSQASVADSPVSRPVIAGDVVLHPGGELRGLLVVDSSLRSVGQSSAGVKLVLVRDAKVVVETLSNHVGRFSVSGLSGGIYGIAVGTRDGVRWNLYRAWTRAAAPPTAVEVAKVVLGDEVLRGQGPLPAVSFSEAALMAGVVVGAVAAPVIYHNAQKSNRIPASP